jgi:hypothetical protein
MVVIKMPGGDIEVVSPAELQWMREAFEHEWSGTVMLRVGGNRIYSVESLGELRQKFGAAGASLADFTPPEGDLVTVVNANNVREVEPASAAQHHERAQAVLKFGARLSLAVRETVDEARAILATAGGRAASLELAAGRSRASRSRSRKTTAKRKVRSKRK